ncbi:Basal-body rod modification protein FlgD [Anaerohalosphaera lusitana]|uniref:Basal-body rod modification protein FlgD n=1 Tax=Anaerohalosphaera lusitana TaxID=1936003 RepID=A0A1U9NGJ4_9BACT|nr:flagellar hook capping FlgD N-terminal domain-containing protein [Anaerohalosphaera lusitana]AQT66925.1 Basal-body rod modification protein FlgD [Anaerohalosphaera lusitana]
MSSINSMQSAQQLQMDYMRLLTTQLQHQNPLDPMDNEQMTAQLTQLSQLGQLEQMNTSFAQVLESTKLNYAGNLVGKEVSFMDYSRMGPNNVPGVKVLGIVEKVDVEGENVMLNVGQYDQSGSKVKTHTINMKEVDTIGFNVTDVLK